MADMSDSPKYKKAGKKSILSLMLLVALSAVAVFIVKVVSDWGSIRARHLLLAAHAAKQRQYFESRVAASSRGVLRAWHSEMAQYYRDIEAKHQRGASRPWDSLPPDPPEPDIPTFQEMWESVTAESRSEEI